MLQIITGHKSMITPSLLANNTCGILDGGADTGLLTSGEGVEDGEGTKPTSS